MNTPSHPNPPSWDVLRQVWRSAPSATGALPQPSARIRRLWVTEARRLRWITFGNWALGLAMAGILSVMAVQVPEGAGRFLLGLSALGCLAQPAWTHRRRRRLWRATAESPRAYWALRTDQAEQAMMLNRAGAWWFGTGLLFGAGSRWLLPKGSLPSLDALAMAGSWSPWVVCGLVFTGAWAVMVHRHRRLSRDLETCRSILASLDPKDESDPSG
jgi:hypothetical protein